MLTSTSWPKIRETGRFCVNVLAGEQHTISDRFAKSGTDKWAGVPWTLNGAGNPAIDDALIWVDCTLHSEHVAGDHLIVLGRIEELSGAEHSDGKKPLIFFKGSYHQLEAG
jgi:flavin reductase (DIM6/NTAB) family NADH-FMN oxidoreductase RutF